MDDGNFFTRNKQTSTCLLPTPPPVHTQILPPFPGELTATRWTGRCMLFPKKFPYALWRITQMLRICLVRMTFFDLFLQLHLFEKDLFSCSRSPALTSRSTRSRWSATCRASATASSTSSGGSSSPRPSSISSCPSSSSTLSSS